MVDCKSNCFRLQEQLRYRFYDELLLWGVETGRVLSFCYRGGEALAPTASPISSHLTHQITCCSRKPEMTLSDARRKARKFLSRCDPKAANEVDKEAKLCVAGSLFFR
mmetsp:Transcript_58229/g.134439  ORF Transcript_58229/g.134439 Transcript_58229/m.134439 type:complete len:108 (+) Transcript_58229:548-871(+)